LKLVSFGDELVKGKASPYFLAQMLKFDFVDMSSDDTCNQQIFRDVIKFLCEEPRDVFILIGWTSGNRLEINWNNKKFTYRPDVHDYYDNGINVLHDSDNILFNDILVGQHRASEAYVLQEILTSKDIPYYMYNTQDCIHFNEKTYLYLRSLNGKNYHNPLNKESSMKYFTQREESKNPDLDWANFLYDKISYKDGK